LVERGQEVDEKHDASTPSTRVSSMAFPESDAGLSVEKEVASRATQPAPAAATEREGPRESPAPPSRACLAKTDGRMVITTAWLQAAARLRRVPDKQTGDLRRIERGVLLIASCDSLCTAKV